jgi:hypothetical protein
MRSRYSFSPAIQPPPIGNIRRWILLAAFGAIEVPGLAKDRPPVTPDGLTMTAEAVAPGASALILYRQVCASLLLR